MKICRAGGREFRLYQEYDEVTRTRFFVYPEFEEHPEYTDEGRPFSTAEREGCPHYRSVTAEEPDTGDCGGCGSFYRESPYDIIGVCMCDALRQGG